MSSTLSSRILSSLVGAAACSGCYCVWFDYSREQQRSVDKSRREEVKQIVERLGQERAKEWQQSRMKWGFGNIWPFSSSGSGKEEEADHMWKTRKEILKAMRKTSRSGYEVDVLVIGGGATGAGCALDAATRGLKTVLIGKSYQNGVFTLKRKIRSISNKNNTMGLLCTDLLQLRARRLFFWNELPLN